MKPQFDNTIRKTLEEIQVIAYENLPKGKYNQIVNRCAKVVATMYRKERAAKTGTNYEEKASPEFTHDEIKAFYDKMATDRKVVLEILRSGRTLNTVECIEMNILRASDVIFKLRKEGYEIETNLIRSGRSRIAEYKLIKEPTATVE